MVISNTDRKRLSSLLLTKDLVRLAPEGGVQKQIAVYGAQEGERRLEIEVAEKWIDELVKKKKSESGPGEDFDFNRGILSKQYKLSAATIDRLFRALLVYSFGIYDMLRSMFKHHVDSSEMIRDYWSLYMSLIEAADSMQYNEAIQAIGEQDIQSRDGQQQVLTDRENKLKKQETNLEMQARQLEERIETLKEHNEVTRQIVDEVEQADALFSSNGKLAEKKLQMEGERVEWMKTIQHHEAQSSELSKTSMHNIGQIDMLLGKKSELEQETEKVIALRSSLQKAIGDLNLRIVATGSVLDADRRRLAELKARAESEAQSKHVLAEIVKSQENLLSQLIASEIRDSRSANDVDVLLNGQRLHNTALEQSIRLQQLAYLETEETLKKTRLERNCLLEEALKQEDILTTSWTVFTDLEQKIKLLEIDALESNVITYNDACRAQKMIDEIDDSVEKSTETNCEIKQLRLELANLQRDRNQHQSELGILTDEQKRLSQCISIAQQNLKQTTAELETATDEYERQNEKFNQFMTSSKHLQQLFEQDLLDSGAKISDEAEDIIQLAAEAEELSLARTDWERTIDVRMASLKAIRDEISEIQSISKAVVARDEEQERLGRKILAECTNTEKNLIPTLAKLDRLKRELLETETSYEKAIIDLEIAITDARDQRQQTLSMLDEEKNCFLNEQNQWTLTLDSAKHRLKIKERRELDSCNNINQSIETSEAYLRNCNEAVQELRLCQTWAEAELKELRALHAFECNLRDNSLLDLCNWSDIAQHCSDHERSLVMKLDKLIKRIAANDEHRVAMERESSFCEIQLIRRKKFVQQRELQLELLENNEWRRLGRLTAKGTQIFIEKMDVSTMTEAARTRGARETLAAAPVLVGLERTFNAVNVVIQENPITRVPRSIRLNLTEKDNFPFDDFKSLSTGTAVDEDHEFDSGKHKQRLSASSLMFNNRLPASVASLRHTRRRNTGSVSLSDDASQLSQGDFSLAWPALRPRATIDRRSFSGMSSIESWRRESNMIVDGHIDPVEESVLETIYDVETQPPRFSRQATLSEPNSMPYLRRASLNETAPSLPRRKASSIAQPNCGDGSNPVIPPTIGSGWSPRPPSESNERFMPSYVRRRLRQIRATSISDLLEN